MYHKVGNTHCNTLESILFSSKAKCKFTNCPVTVSLIMRSDFLVTVVYNGSVSHEIHEIHCRPIRGPERQKLRNEFKSGLKPLVKYIDVFENMSESVVMSGNFDGLGKDTNVFR